MADHQQDAGPVDAPAEPVSTQQALRDVLFADEQNEEQVSEEVEEAEPVEGELEETDFDEEGEEEGEQETAITAPVSLTAEEKAAFAALDPSAQQYVAALEARRNADVTKVTTKAAEAQRAAEAQAAQSVLEYRRQEAERFNAFVQNFAPQMPDPRLAQSDPAAYVAAKAHYDAQIGQFTELVNTVKGMGNEAEQESQRAFIEARDKALMQIPEIANEETRQQYLDRVFDPEFVQALGYERSELASIVDAEDVKRLNTIAGWREKAAKYDQAMSRKMQRVRQGKARATKPGTAQDQSTSRQRALQEAKARQKATNGREGTKEALRAALFS